MIRPFVSVAMPAYKSSFLRQAIDSVLRQTYDNFELIIVNDCSPEPIDDIVGSYHDDRIRYYVNEQNIGGKDPVANWNRCLSYAKGEFFALLCDDDLYSPTFLETLLKLAALYPDVDVFRSGVKLINGKNETMDFFPSSPTWESAELYLWHIVSGVRRQTISEFLYRKKRLDELHGYVSFPKAWCADFASVVLFASKGGIVSTTEWLSSFRMSGENLSTEGHRNAVEKIVAHTLFTGWIHDFVARKDNLLGEIIIQKRKGNEQMEKTSYLIQASWNDFFHLCFNHRDKRYSIDRNSFLKAFFYKLANMFNLRK